MCNELTFSFVWYVNVMMIVCNWLVLPQFCIWPLALHVHACTHTHICICMYTHDWPRMSCTHAHTSTHPLWHHTGTHIHITDLWHPHTYIYTHTLIHPWLLKTHMSDNPAACYAHTQPVRVTNVYHSSPLVIIEKPLPGKSIETTHHLIAGNAFIRLMSPAKTLQFF